MYFICITLLSALTLQDVCSYSAHRSPRLTTVKNLGSQEIVIPARYKIKGKPNYDSTIGQNIHTDNFPEVEYPSSIMDSSKPFYLDVSPFSNDVKSSFKCLVAGGPTKATPTIVLNLKRNDNCKGNNNTNATGSQKLDSNETTIAEANKINSNDKGANETVYKEALTLEDEILSTISSEKKNDSDDMDYVIRIIDDLDDFISTFTTIETEIIDINNCTTKEFDNAHSKEFVKITTDVTSGNADSVGQFNDGSMHTQSNPLLDKLTDSLSTTTTLTDKHVTEPCLSDEIQDESDSISETANDSNTFRVEQ